MYVLSTGCQWRYLPKDLPPRSTVYRYFLRWGIDGILDRIHHALYVKCREQAEREASPTAAIIDSQSVKSAEKGGPHRSARVRCRQDDQGQEASYSRRYPGPVDARYRSFGRHPGSRRRHSVAVDAVRPVPLPRKAVCRQRLSRADFRRSPRQDSGPVSKRDRQTNRSSERVREVTQALDRRANDRMAQPLPQTRQGLGKPQPTALVFSVSPPSVSCCESSAILRDLSSQTLQGAGPERNPWRYSSRSCFLSILPTEVSGSSSTSITFSGMAIREMMPRST